MSDRAAEKMIAEIRATYVAGEGLWHHQCHSDVVYLLDVLAAETKEREAAQLQYAEAERSAHEQEQRAMRAEAALSRLREALALFTPGSHDGLWGRIKAWIVGGAPTREQGIQVARKITEWQVDLDAALAVSRQLSEEGQP